MKRIFCLVTVLAALALGTSAFAAAFTAGDIVVFRVGDGTQPLTNIGNTVFLDEYRTSDIAFYAGSSSNPTPVQSIQIPTNWVGAQAPLIAEGGSGEGLMTLSKDGRYLVLAGFGATLSGGASPTYQITDRPLAGATCTGLFNQVARVVGLVDGFGHIYTTTVQTNRNEEGDDIRSAASLDGTNIWVGGYATLLKYMTRGSMLSTEVCDDISLIPVHAVNIYGNTLYADRPTGLDGATNTQAAVNPFGGSLPTSYVAPNFVSLPGVGPDEAYGFAMFNLNGGPGVDTLYIADTQANLPGGPPYSGGVLKYCYIGGTWVSEGGIGAAGAFGVTGVQNGTNVTLYITAEDNTLYTYTDTTGFGNYVYVAASSEFLIPPGVANAALINLGGIAVVPQGGDSGTITGPGALSIGPPYGAYFSGPAGGPFTPSNFVYSVANLGTTTTNFYVSFSANSGGNWLTATPSSGTLAAGASMNVSVAPNATAMGDASGYTYTGNLIWRYGNVGGQSFGTNTATLVDLGLFVTPTTNFISVGKPGGPFTPSSAVYTLSNATAGALSWSALTSNTWTSLSATSGSLAGNASTNITVSINANANSLVNIGTYDDYLVFSNVTAGTALSAQPAILLQVGFGIFDDFSAFAAGNVVGQNNWDGSLTATNPVQITNGLYTVPGGCPGGSAQQPYKYVAAGPLTNPAAYAILGMSVTITNGSPSPNYIFGFGTSFLTWDDAGILDVGDALHYVWTSELNAYQTGGGAVGTNEYSYGTPYQVFLVADFVNSNSWVFVNPGTNDFATMMSQSPAVQSIGVGCNYCPGASPEGWTRVNLGQYSQCPGKVEAGYMISRVAASTNYADVYNFLTQVPNSWVNASSGKWETATNWSAGVAPSITDLADVIANATNKTVTIDATTVLSNTANGCMTISNLTVSAPLGATNTLLLNNAGTATPLSILNALMIGTNGTVVVGNQSAVQAFSNLLVGVTGGTGALTITNSAAVSVTNASANAVLEVRGGTLSLNGGTVTVNQLVLTNGANSVFTFSAGTLASGGTFVTNNQVFAVGDGTDAATFQLNGGVHSFANKLEIRTSAVLSGCGTINGTVVVDPGGSVQANCGGNLNFMGIVTNNGTVTASNGTVLKFYGLVVNNGLIDGSGGDVQFFSTISNNGVILTPTNSWIDGSGKWETATNWSHATAPSSTDAADLITNAGNNTVTIDGTTAGSFPGTLTIRNLTVSAPGIATNTLFLNNVGTNTPLRVLGVLTLGTNAAMVVNNSAVLGTNSVSIGNSSASSSLVVSNGGSLIVTNGGGTGSVVVNGGSLILGTGTFKTDNLVVTNGGVVQHTQTYQVDNATLTIAGGSQQAGSNLVAGTSANSTGTVTVTDGGQLVVTNGVVGIGNSGTLTNGSGVGLLAVSNGTVLANQILLGSSAGGQGQLTILTNGLVNLVGTNAALVVDGPSGLVVDGGALNILNGFFEIGFGGSGSMSMSDGSASCMVVFVGYESRGENGQGTLTISGGQMIISSTLDLGFSSGDTGWVWLSGGTLTANGNTIIIGGSGVGQLTLSNGSTVVASALSVGTSGVTGSGGTLTVAGGTLTVSAGLTVGTGTVWVSGGQLLASSSSIVVGSNGMGQMTITNGTVQANSLVLTNGANSQFAFSGGALSSGGTVVTNSQSFLVGNNSSAATFNLMGGVHWFGNGLEIANNATLTGCGTVNGNVTIDSGATALANCGTLTFTGIVTNNGTMRANGGSVLESYSNVVNNGTIDIINGATNFPGTFINPGTVLTASSVKISQVSKSGQDFVVQIPSVTGHTYQLQYTTSLTPATWTPGASKPGGGVLTFTDTGGAANPQRFYRVAVTAP